MSTLREHRLRLLGERDTCLLTQGLKNDGEVREARALL